MNNHRQALETLSTWLLMALCCLLPQQVQATACSPNVNDMTINEVYDLNDNNAWVETKRLDESIASAVYNNWSLRLCEGKKGCWTYSLADAVVLNPDTFPNHLILEVNGKYTNLDNNGGMDAVLLDEAGQCIDYLSVNGYSEQAPSCTGFSYPTATGALASSPKGIFRAADGTGPWHELEGGGATGEPTKGASNTGLEGVVDHYRIAHPASALTCQAADITVRACEDSDCSSYYVDTVDLILVPASGWIGGNEPSFDGGSGIFQLRQGSDGSVTLGLSANPAPSGANRCYVGGIESDCTITFYDAGFVVSVPDLTSCQSSAVPFIQAVRKDDETEACVADGGFANQPKTVGFWVDYLQPDTGSKVPSLNGNALTTAFPGTDVSLIFDNDARSTFELTYDDAGQLQLNARYAGSGDEAGLIMTGNDSFVVAPHSLRVQATTDGTTPLDNTISSGTPHWPAGEDFSVEVAGVCSDGTTVTPNFAADVTLSAVGPYLPAAGVLGALNGGSLTTADFSAGVARDDSVYYTEVGTVTISAETEDYLVNGIDVSGSSAPVGRFTPARFALSWYQTPVWTPACSSGEFTYLGQPFGYFAAPVVKVTAQNMQGSVTANYTQSDWWKITDEAALLSGRSYTAAEGTLELSGAEVSVDFPVDGAGSGTLTFDQGSAMKFVRGAPVGPFYAAIDLQINVEDADLISASAPLSISDIPFVGEDKVNGINTDEMRWGRLVLQNAYGSELVPLAMPLRAEYFNGSSFVFNSGDGCTSVALTQLSLTNGVDTFTADNDIPVGGGATTASLVNPLDAGDAHLSFTPPGDEGYVDVTADLSLLDWLRYDWDGDGTHDDHPLGRATFGIYKGQPNLIYMRETFR